MEIQIGKSNYKVIDAKEKITIADSFVVRQNKIGGGNGEAKLYVGNDNPEVRSFFGNTGFTIPCFLLKKDLLLTVCPVRIRDLSQDREYISPVS